MIDLLEIGQTEKVEPGDALKQFLPAQVKSGLLADQEFASGERYSQTVVNGLLDENYRLTKQIESLDKNAMEADEQVASLLVKLVLLFLFVTGSLIWLFHK